MSARALRLRQDHGAAPDRRLHGADRGRDRARRPRRVSPGAHAAARAAQRVDGVPELRAVAAHDGGRERRLRPRAAQARPRDNRREGRGDPRHHAARPAGRALSGRAVGRPAAARLARPRAGRGARNSAARRAAVEPRRQPARGDALRGAPPARRLSLHDDLRHPRPERGDDDRRPHRRDERRAHRAAGHAAGGLRCAALGVRRALPGRQQHPARQGAGREPGGVCRHGRRLQRRAAGARRGRRRVHPPARHRHLGRRSPQPERGSAVEGTVVRNVFLGATRDYIVEARDGTQLRITAPPE